MNLEGVEVAGDEQGRVVQIVFVQKELVIGRLEVGMSALLLPGEESLVPHIGPAPAAAGLLRAALKAVEGAMRVSLRRCGKAKQPAQIDKVFLRARFLFERGVLPLSDKFGKIHNRGLYASALSDSPLQSASA